MTVAQRLPTMTSLATFLRKTFAMGAALLLTTFGTLTAAAREARVQASLSSPQVKFIDALAAHDGQLIALAWSPDGKLLASLGEDRRVKFWDERGKQTGTLIETLSSARAIYWSPDSEKIAAVGGRVATIFRVDGSEIVRLTGHQGDITSFSWSSDSRAILTSSEDRTSKLWDAHSGRTILTITPGGGQRKQTKSLLKALFTRDVLFDSESTAASFASDQTIVTASMTAFSNKFPRLWDVATGQQIGKLQAAELDSKPEFVAISPDRRTIITSGFSEPHMWDTGTSDARMWDAGTGKLIGTLPEIAGGVRFSPDGKKILANGCIRRTNVGCYPQAGIWDVATRQRIMTLDSPTDEFIGLGWSGDATKVVTSVRHKHASIWDAETGRLITTVALVKDRGWVTDYEDDLILSRAGQILFAVTDKYVKFWNATTGDLILEHDSLKKGTPLPFSVRPQGDVAAAADGKTGKLWFWSIDE
jgi:WD40 repeat protein